MISDSLRSSISLDVSYQLVKLTEQLEKLGLYCELNRKLACIFVYENSEQKGPTPLVIICCNSDKEGAPFITYFSFVPEDDDYIEIWQRASILYKATHIKTLIDNAWKIPRVKIPGCDVK